MIKKSITYTNFNDEEVTEDFYFHLSKLDLLRMEAKSVESLEKRIERIGAGQATPGEILETLELFISSSYGIRSADGRNFNKNERLKEEFLSSPAYEALIFEIATDAEKGAEFVNGLMPANLEAELEKLTVKPVKYNPHPEIAENTISEDLEADHPIYTGKITRVWLTRLSTDEISHLIATGKAVIAD